MQTKGTKPGDPGRPASSSLDPMIVAKRTSPALKSAGRQNYEANLSETGTGDPGLNEDLRRLVARNATFGSVGISKPKLDNPVTQLSQGLKRIGSRLLGNRPSTPAEEEHYKAEGQKAFYEAKAERNRGGRK